MKFDIISTIVIETRRFSYELNQDGTRKINRESSTPEELTFKFDAYAIQHIIFREGPMVVWVDDKQLFFDYKKNVLSGIHFESDKYIWVMTNFQDFLNQCREAYLRQKITERFLGIMDECHEYQDREELDGIVDEFDVESSDSF